MRWMVKRGMRTSEDLCFAMRELRCYQRWGEGLADTGGDQVGEGAEVGCEQEQLRSDHFGGRVQHKEE